MLQDHLADDLDRSTGARSICGGMSVQMMRSQVDPCQFPGFLNNKSRCGIGYREGPLTRFNPPLANMLLESGGKPRRNEDRLFPSATLRVPDNQSLAINIIGSEFQDFADSDTPSSGH